MKLPEQRWHAAFVLEAPVLADRPVRVVFGTRSLQQVGREAAALGQRALLIAGPHEDVSAERIADQLRTQSGADLMGRLREVGPHITVEMAAVAASRTRELGADVLIAVGGGSATGIAKAVSRASGLPIVAVPTTYAGSEMTPIWGLTDTEGKTTGRDARVLPHTVIYDPLVTFSLPPALTAASGMNALAHAVEALYAPDSSPTTSSVAEEAIAALATALPVAVVQPENHDARAQALYGAWLAGWALGSTTMGLHHKLAHVLGGTYRLQHASVHSALLPQVAAYNASAAGGSFTGAVRALGAEAPAGVGAALFDLATLMGAPTSLAALGLAASAIEQVAATVTAGKVINPRPITEPDLVRVLRDAHGGIRPNTISPGGSDD